MHAGRWNIAIGLQTRSHARLSRPVSQYSHQVFNSGFRLVYWAMEYSHWVVNPGVRLVLLTVIQVGLPIPHWVMEWIGTVCSRHRHHFDSSMALSIQYWSQVQSWSELLNRCSYKCFDIRGVGVRRWISLWNCACNAPGNGRPLIPLAEDIEAREKKGGRQWRWRWLIQRERNLVD